MPGIPLYQQQTTAQGSFDVRAPAGAFGGDIAQAAGRVAASLQDVGQGEALERRSNDLLLKQQQERDAKAWVGTAVSGATLDWTQTVADRQQTAAPGAPGFTPKLLSDFDDYASKALDNAPTPIAKQFLQQHLNVLRTRLGTHAIEFEANARVSMRNDQALKSIDDWGKVVQQDPGQYQAALTALRETMPYSGPNGDHKLNDAAVKTLTNAAFSHALDADPYAVQDATSKALGDKGFTGSTGVPWVDDASPDQVRTWNNAATTKIRMLESEQARDVQARNKAAEDQFGAATDMTFKGQYMSEPYKATLLATVKGTQWEAATRELIDSQKFTAGFASAPADDRAAILDQWRSHGSNPSQGTTPEGAKQLAKVQAIDAAIRTAVDKNPWEAAQQYGVTKSAPLVKIDSPASVMAVIAQRAQEQGRIEAWTGKRISPLQPEEEAQFASVLAKLPPDQEASALGAVGMVIGNSDRVAALAKHLQDKDGTLGIAMAYANSQTTEGRFVAELMLRGAQAEKDGTIKVDGAKETGWKATIAKQIRGAYSNREAEDQIVRAAYLIAGAKDGDVDNAVLLATGGIIDYNGSKVPLPYGMATDGLSSGESKFHKAIGAITPEMLASQTPGGKVNAGGVSMSAADFVKSLPDARLVHAGQGFYNVRAGTTLVTNSAGKRITLKVSP